MKCVPFLNPDLDCMGSDFLDSLKLMSVVELQRGFLLFTAGQGALNADAGSCKMAVRGFRRHVSRKFQSFLMKQNEICQHLCEETKMFETNRFSKPEKAPIKQTYNDFSENATYSCV